MPIWPQNYDPLQSAPLSTLVAALPVLTLFFVLLVLKTRVWVAALSGMVVAIALAIAVFDMPAAMTAAAAGHGFIFGVLRIAWIIIASIFLYNIAVETGQFQVMKDSIAALSADRRLQLVLIAFCFGAFLEGTGGGGAPVAIAGAFLIGLGFHPFQAATLCLIANTAPVAWGGVGNPIRVLAGVTGLPEFELSAMTGRILPPLAAILPFWLVRSMVGWRETFDVWPALAVSGLSFAAMQFYWSNFQETGLVDIIAAIFSLLVMVGVSEGVASANDPGERCGRRRRPRGSRGHSTATVLKGWSPFILSSVLIFVASYPALEPNADVPVAPAADAVPAQPRLSRPAGRARRRRRKPRSPTQYPRAARDGRVRRRGGRRRCCSACRRAASLQIFGRTFVAADAVAGLAISFMVGLAFVTRYSGMDTVMGLTLDAHRLGVPVLRDAARLARRRADRHRRRVERAVRQPAEGHRGAARASARS